ncbi:MAG: hypothetical protein HYV41_03330 [Candidatus Magasanikbacteria bacterium]|nr:hypothetical protein [Candidatus Magasanikbacteria bacterium]
MKYIIISISIAVSLVFFSQVSALDLGQGLVKDAGKAAGYDENTSDITLSENVGKVINIALSVVGVLFTILMVYAGYLWMTARGKDEQIEKAKTIIVASIIGLFITLGAYSISNFVVPRILDASTGAQEADG